MSDQQPGSFGATVGQGEWGLFQDFLRTRANVERDPEAARVGGERRLQEGQVAALERWRRHHGGAAARGGSTARLAGPGAAAGTCTGALFLLPAFVLLGVWIVYPTVYTIVRSFFGQSGFGHFVGIDNYKTLFTTSTLRDGDQEQPDLGRGRPGARDRDRARSSRC